MISALFLTSCSAFDFNSAAASSQTANTVSTETQLILGTIKLEGTELAVSADQADDLLLYWQVYKELGASSTSAQEERDGLLEQIQETMTAEQLQAINDLDISANELAMQGGPISSSTSKSNSSTPGNTGGFSSPAGGDIGLGGPPDGGGMPMDADGGPQPQSTGSTSNTAQQSNISGPASTPIDSLIEILSDKVNA
jgi:hypothetical protein